MKIDIYTVDIESTGVMKEHFSFFFKGENIYRLLKWKSNFDFRAYANSWNFHSFFSFTSINPFWLRNFSIRLVIWILGSFCEWSRRFENLYKTSHIGTQKNWFWFVASSFFLYHLKALKEKVVDFYCFFKLTDKFDCDVNDLLIEC